MKRIYACILIVAALLAVSLYSSGRVRRALHRTSQLTWTVLLKLYGRKIFPLHGGHLPRVQNCAIPCGKL